MVFEFTDYGRNSDRVKAFQALVVDGLVHIPASSVQVERLHANLQVNNFTRHMAGRQASVIQQNSYLVSTFLEQQVLRSAIDSECLGDNKTRASALLRRRSAEESLPCRTSTQLQPRPAKRLASTLHLASRSRIHSLLENRDVSWRTLGGRC